MYFDRKSHVIRWVICTVVLAALVFTGAWFFVQRSSKDMREETELAIRETIRKAALQCFTVEGAYPESLAALTEKYGLRINTEDYYVVYDVFADNLPPNIRVAKKEG